MTRPYPHPKTGVYWVRKVVPAALRPAVGRRELMQSLRTKDPKEARSKAPAVLAQFEATLEAARLGGGAGRQVSLRDITALTGEWYRREWALWADEPDQYGPLDIAEG
ncbi:MAG TPA: DUF6538 domain-containing protein, partial [Acetobacteraceae bacterium]|nr:DUF6538 domain-containing protein [Acetobacteraceae bacterium]